MKRLAALLLLSPAAFLLLAAPLSAQSTTTITATMLLGGDGVTPIGTGLVTFQPTDINGNPIFANVYGGGLMTPRPATCFIAAGAITTNSSGGTCKVVNTALSNPATFCYLVTIKDTVANWTAPPLKCVQPSGSTWSFDTYVPPAAPTAMIVAGPTGAAGAGYINGLTSNGSNGINVAGSIAAGATNPTSIDNSGIHFPDGTVQSAKGVPQSLGGQGFGDSTFASTGVSDAVSQGVAYLMQTVYGPGSASPALTATSGNTCEDTVARNVYPWGVQAQAGSPLLSVLECGVNDAGIGVSLGNPTTPPTAALENAYATVLSAAAYESIPIQFQINGSNYSASGGSTTGTVATTSTINTDVWPFAVLELESAGASFSWTTTDTTATGLYVNYMVNSGTSGLSATVVVDSTTVGTIYNYGFGGINIGTTNNPTLVAPFAARYALTQGVTHTVTITCPSCSGGSPFAIAWIAAPGTTPAKNRPQVGVFGTIREIAGENDQYTTPYYTTLQSVATQLASDGQAVTFIPTRNFVGLDAQTPSGSSSPVTGWSISGTTATIYSSATYSVGQPIVMSGLTSTIGTCLNGGNRVTAQNSGNFTMTVPIGCTSSSASATEAGSVVPTYDCSMTGISTTLPNGHVCLPSVAVGKHPGPTGNLFELQAIESVFPAPNPSVILPSVRTLSAAGTLLPSDGTLWGNLGNGITINDPTTYSIGQEFQLTNASASSVVALTFNFLSGSTSSNLNVPTSIPAGQTFRIKSLRSTGVTKWVLLNVVPANSNSINSAASGTVNCGANGTYYVSGTASPTLPTTGLPAVGTLCRFFNDTVANATLTITGAMNNIPPTLGPGAWVDVQLFSATPNWWAVASGNGSSFNGNPQVVAQVAATTYSGTAGVGTTALITPSSAHVYRACATLVTTVAGSGGTFAVNIYWHGDSHLFGPISLTGSVSASTQWSANAVGSSCQTFYNDSGSNIQYSLSASSVTGSPTVRYSVTLEQLQ